MARIIWTESALLDLNDIAEYIALDKVTAANQLVSRIFKRVELLSSSPDSGRQPPELSKSNLNKSKYKEVIVGPCRIFYRVINDEIIILYIMRSEQKLRHYILQDREKDQN